MTSGLPIIMGLSETNEITFFTAFTDWLGGLEKNTYLNDTALNLSQALAMQSIPLKKEAVLSIFGTRAGTKLLNFLNDCCQPTISLSCVASCAGLDSSGNPTYNIVASAIYSTSIAGYTSLIGYVSNEPFPDWGNVTSVSLNNLNLNEATIFVNNIVAGVPCVMANLSGVDGITPGTYFVMVTDNRGNFAEPITITFPNCQ